MKRTRRELADSNFSQSLEVRSARIIKFFVFKPPTNCSRRALLFNNEASGGKSKACISD